MHDAYCARRNARYMTGMAKYIATCDILSNAITYSNNHQEGLKAHEGGQHHANPFDMFSSFFGGRELMLF